MKRSKILLVFLFGLIAVLTLLRIGVSNRISLSGATLANLEDEINMYQSRNMALNQEITTLASFSNVASEAGRLGFVGTKNGYVINSVLPLAQKQ